MTSVATFNMGPAAGAGAGAFGQPSAHYEWAIQHHPPSISRQLPLPSPWDYGELDGGEAPGAVQGQTASHLEPLPLPLQEPQPRPPIEWLSAPLPLSPGPLPWQVRNFGDQDGINGVFEGSSNGGSWGSGVPWGPEPDPQSAWGVMGQPAPARPTAKPLGSPNRGGGGGVVSLLPWLVGMTVVGSTDPAGSPAGSGRPGLSPSRSGSGSGSNRPSPSRPLRPRPARPGAGAGAGGGGGVGARGSVPVPGQGTTNNGKLEELYKWKQVGYAFPSASARAEAIKAGDYIPENNLPLGVEAYKDRLFISIPRWKPGVPATLATVPRKSNGTSSPLLEPYPDWSWHRIPQANQNDSCTALTSVFRMAADECGRLWVLDSGSIDVIGDAKVICPPQIVIFDMNTDKLIWRYVIPKEQTKPESLFTNIAVDIRNGQCDDAFAYAADVFRYGLLVYSWREDRSWRVSNNLMLPDPIASRYVLNDVVFRWQDGIFGLALTSIDSAGDRTLFFHPMSSFMEFSVKTSVLRDQKKSEEDAEAFKVVGRRARSSAHSSASAMDRRGVLFFNLVTQDALGCWDSSKRYSNATVGYVAQDHALINFPNDLKVDKEDPQNIWLLSNRLHLYLYKSLDPNEYNYRILTATVEKATDGTICDPKKRGPDTTVPQDIDACDVE